MDLQVYDIVLIPIIVGVIEVFKRAGLPNRFVPLAALILGIIIGTVYLDPSNIFHGILWGASLGLSSVGLYSGTKNVMEGDKKDVSNKKRPHSHKK